MKKQLLFLLAVVFGLTACDKQETFNVSVSLVNGNDRTVYLQKFVDNEPVIIDSTVINKDQAVLKAPVDNPQILYALKVKGRKGSMPFFADNKDVVFVGDMNNPQAIEIMASETQAEWDAFNEQLGQFDEQIQELYICLQQAFNENDTVKVDSLNVVGTALMKQQDSFRDEYIKAHPESFVTHYILDGVKQDYPIDQLKEMVGSFTTESIYRDHLKEYIAGQERLEVGQPFIDFTLKTKEGENVSFAEVIAQNKITMVDFWASWCGPCRHENPVVKAAYEQFHELGFDVISVSVDQDEAAWLEALEEDQLPWTQVRDIEHKASDDYMIFYIPANFLYDQHGIMVAKGLRGEELATKLSELLK
jgi:peroxiredoxin